MLCLHTLGLMHNKPFLSSRKEVDQTLGLLLSSTIFFILTIKRSTINSKENILRQHSVFVAANICRFSISMNFQIGNKTSRQKMQSIRRNENWHSSKSKSAPNTKPCPTQNKNKATPCQTKPNSNEQRASF